MSPLHLLPPAVPALPAGLPVLLVVDPPARAAGLVRLLEAAAAERYAPRAVGGTDEALRALHAGAVGCVVLDLDGTPGHDLDALARLRAAALEVPLVALCPSADRALAVRVVAEGAQDVLVHDELDAATLDRAVAFAVERTAREARLAHQALHDPLTGLPNRELFVDRLGQALSRLERAGSTVAALFLDLDGFKAVNDRLGHEAGDRLLQAVGDRLRDVLRAGDTAARFGGDEFTVLCEDVTGERHAIAVAERICRTLAAPFPLPDGDVEVRASIGIALASGAGQAAADVVRDADAALYRAKEQGGGVVEVFDEAMRARLRERRDTELALGRALDRGEFSLRYQPQVDLVTGAVVGLEALVRWEDPRRGLQAPGDFIGTAEETGLILPLGAWVLEEACDESRRRPALGGVAVNLSLRQFTHPDLVDAVAGALARTGADPAGVRLEVTELAVLADLDAAAAVLGALKGLGVRLSMDDFGAGPASLRALQRLPFDEVKVDASFVRRLGDGQGASAVVGAVVELAHTFGRTVVAEGVETRAQADELVRLGCDVGQGFLFHRPVTAAELPRPAAAA